MYVCVYVCVYNPAAVEFIVVVVVVVDDDTEYTGHVCLLWLLC
jgi:hypothetical protein